MRKLLLSSIFVVAILALVATASAALPPTVTATISNPGATSYWDVTITSGGNGDLPNGYYPGWCADSQQAINSGSHTFDVYSSLGANPTSINSANWHKINYILNHKGDANKYTVQAAIWYFDGGIIPWGTPEGTKDSGKLGALIADAEANGGSYSPGPGDVYAVILWNGESTQAIIIEVPIPDIPVPEFPSIALPVSMLLGVVFIVHVARSRKN
ncbi:MAG TPA: hypothetical protein PKM50_09170 [Methanoregula sp.]|nr:hypothetical protein [Methanoregula sp.]